ncbi:hypothetical protein AOLI_G00114700 [Acnodon oligacanthus]
MCQEGQLVTTEEPKCGSLKHVPGSFFDTTVKFQRKRQDFFEINTSVQGVLEPTPAENITRTFLEALNCLSVASLAQSDRGFPYQPAASNTLSGICAIPISPTHIENPREGMKDKHRLLCGQ